MDWTKNKALKKMTALIVLLPLLLLYGCASKTGGGEEVPTEQIEGSASPEGNIGEEELAGIRSPNTVSEGRTSAPFLPIYFDFDKFNIKPDMQPRLEENARYLIQHPEVRIEIQGNCDERGTNEYNLALGEKRSLAAKKYLVNLGVNPEQIETVSFGEERPIDCGPNQDPWACNRRDDLVIIK